MDERLIAGATVYKKRGGLPVWLIVKSNKDSDWELPKGPVRRAESSVASILRTMREETGVIMVVLEEAGRTTVFTTRNGARSSDKSIFYLGERISAAPGESIYQQKRWLPYTQARRILGLERERKMLRQANSELRQWKKKKNL